MAGVFCATLADAAPAGASEIDLLLFGSLDAGAASFLTTGAKVAFEGLDRPGFVVLASAGGGRRSESVACGCARSVGVARYTAVGAALVGYQWFLDWGVVAAYAGPEGSIEALTDGRTAAVLPARYGLRLHGEVWARPTAETLVQATAILGSAREDAWGRIAWGVRAWDTYFGPEVSLYTDRTGYRKWNLGLHATDFAFGRYSFRVSGGVQVESSTRGASPYVALSVWTPL
ncbi:cellulose biosynthesis protein BcsS [Methylobacterium trifolii]|uniref:cellulose biosynthesis protein BcsS n=1 Tax=Methylobacterium trifolii TaxID=1003092 RepID=UPI001EDEBD71|nr:cellulose biosynthesis protein BcsS [Methylobacterium trifolii]